MIRNVNIGELILFWFLLNKPKLNLKTVNFFNKFVKEFRGAEHFDNFLMRRFISILILFLQVHELFKLMFMQLLFDLFSPLNSLPKFLSHSYFHFLFSTNFLFRNLNNNIEVNFY